MSRVHMIAVQNPPVWEECHLSHAECGILVPEPRPVFTVDWHTAYISMPNTIMFCHKCWEACMKAQPGIRYVYGILPAEEALKVNAGSEEAA